MGAPKSLKKAIQNAATKAHKANAASNVNMLAHHGLQI